MQITFAPALSDATLSLHRSGEVLAIDGVAFDLAPLPEGAILPQAAFGAEALAGDVTRQGGRLRLVLRLPHGPQAAPDLRFPAPLDPVPEGAVVAPGLVPPPQATTPGAIDWAALVTPEAALDGLRAEAAAALLALIEARAEALTGPVPLAEKLSWTAKEEAARAHLAGAEDPVMRALLDGEAQMTGETLDRLAGRIVANADAWRGAVAMLAGLRRQTLGALAGARDAAAVAAVLQAAEAALHGRG